MKLAALTLAFSLVAVPAKADAQWEGWEPKNILPSQAEATLEEQAITPVEIVQHVPHPNPDVERWRSMVGLYAGWDVERMLRIMDCESKGVPEADNPRSSAMGLFQIMHSIWYDGRNLYDPVVNVDVAHYVWTQQGYGAWVCRG